MTKIEAASGDANASVNAHASATPTIVSLGELVDRRVPLEWYESVAIVAGLCSNLARTGATEMPVAADIILSPEGTIVVTGNSGTHSLVALPRLLHELLSVTTPPTPLRLLVLHTISTDGDKTPATFGTALAYYERPGRETWIRSARQRFFDAPLPTAEPGQPRPSEMLDVQPAAIAAIAAVTAPPVRRTRVIVTTLVACAALAALVVSQTRTSGTNIFADGWTTVQAMAAHVAEAGRTLAQKVGGPSKPGTSNPSETKPAPEAAPTTGRPKSQNHKVPTQLASSFDSGHEGVAVPAVESPVDARVEPEESAVAPSPIHEQSAVTPVETIGDARSENGAILPPRLLDPVRLPSWAQPADATSKNIIELDIAATGSVKRVRLVSTPTRLTDMMILSAAKTWVFEPASSGGRSVPYRMALNWVPPNR
jgi:hypothetical protein